MSIYAETVIAISFSAWYLTLVASCLLNKPTRPECRARQAAQTTQPSRVYGAPQDNSWADQVENLLFKATDYIPILQVITYTKCIKHHKAWQMITKSIIHQIKKGLSMVSDMCQLYYTSKHDIPHTNHADVCHTANIRRAKPKIRITSKPCFGNNTENRL